MSTTLKDDLHSAHELMRRVLRDGHPLVDEYPLVFGQGFSGRVVALSDGDEVQSACAILEREFVTEDAVLRVGLIGSVSTDPRFRHRGLATRVLREAEQVLRQRGCLLALLWADDPRFYFLRGYRPIGWELDFVLTEKVAQALPQPTCARPAAAADAPHVHRLYQGHAHRVERKVEETAALLECPGMETLVAPSDHGVRAYACLGRGRDLGGTVHEWGGELEGVLELLAAHWHAAQRTSGRDEMYVMAPPSRVDLRRALEQAGAQVSHGILGLGKLLDRRAGAELLRSHVTLGRIDIEETAQGAPVIRLEGPNGSASLDDDAILGLLLGSRGGKEELRDYSRRLMVDFRALPLTPFAWGLDSI